MICTKKACSFEQAFCVMASRRRVVKSQIKAQCVNFTKRINTLQATKGKSELQAAVKSLEIYSKNDPKKVNLLSIFTCVFYWG